MGGRKKIGNQQQPERHKRIKSFQRFFERGVFEWRKEFFFFSPFTISYHLPSSGIIFERGKPDISFWAYSSV
jgi:hypothetical protein